jgi:DNA-binding PucR family transcriptional regulator
VFAHACRVAAVALLDDPAAGTSLYRLMQGFAAGHPGLLLVARVDRGACAVGPADGDWPAALHGAIAADLGPAAIGVGMAVDGPRAYRESFVLARKAMRVLAALGRDGVLSLEQPGLLQLIVQATEPERLASFAERLVGPLREHDRQRGSELVHTLELAFRHGWNLQAAARTAHVHVSTLRYRLRRIEALAGVDLQLEDDRLAMHLALRTAKVLEA